MKCEKRKKRYNLIKWISGVFFLAVFNCFFSCKSVPSEPEKEITDEYDKVQSLL